MNDCIMNRYASIGEEKKAIRVWKAINPWNIRFPDAANNQRFFGVVK